MSIWREREREKGGYLLLLTGYMSGGILVSPIFLLKDISFPSEVMGFKCLGCVCLCMSGLFLTQSPALYIDRHNMMPFHIQDRLHWFFVCRFDHSLQDFISWYVCCSLLCRLSRRAFYWSLVKRTRKRCKPEYNFGVNQYFRVCVCVCTYESNACILKHFALLLSKGSSGG